MRCLDCGVDLMGQPHRTLCPQNPLKQAIALSAQPCGCDPGAKYHCSRHKAELATTMNKWLDKGETRTVDVKTGGEKGTKLARFDLMPSEALWALAEHYGKGSEKYQDRNWEKGYAWGLCVAALQRHLHLWLQGESIDAETGTNHMIAVAWHAFALFIFEVRGIGTDDVRRKS